MGYSSIFWEILKKPFQEPALIWGIVPLYFAWMLNEMTSSRASYRTALQTGFSLVWAGAHWTYLYFNRGRNAPELTLNALLAVNVIVTVITLAFGLVAFISGLCRRYPPYGSFLGH